MSDVLGPSWGFEQRQQFDGVHGEQINVKTREADRNRLMVRSSVSMEVTPELQG